MKKSTTILILLLICVFIIVFPLLTVKDSEFAGADGKAEDAIGQVDPEYTPWAESLIEPPGGETESLLFSLQAAFGGGIIGLGFGYFLGKRSSSKNQ